MYGLILTPNEGTALLSKPPAQENKLLIVAIVVVAVAVFAAVQFMGHLGKNEQESALVVIAENGNTLYNLPLSENAEQTVATELGTNIVQIQDGKVRVREADCPNQDCVNQGWISNSSAQIVCLPHKLTVSIVNDGKQNVDTVAQ